jgi:hypothetical protein
MPFWNHTNDSMMLEGGDVLVGVDLLFILPSYRGADSLGQSMGVADEGGVYNGIYLRKGQIGIMACSHS